PRAGRGPLQHLVGLPAHRQEEADRPPTEIGGCFALDIAPSGGGGRIPCALVAPAGLEDQTVVERVGCPQGLPGSPKATPLLPGLPHAFHGCPPPHAAACCPAPTGRGTPA